MRQLKLLVAALLALVPSLTNAQRTAPSETVLNRFLRYVTVNTQSAEDAGTIPSTPQQFDLARQLAAELERLGATDVFVDAHAIVYAKLPSNLPAGVIVPGVGFIAHMDTAPNEPGANVHPVVHTSYRGGDITLPADTTQVIRVAENPDLPTRIGDDIVTADGTTLLGSDDKAGIAEIMTLVDVLRANPGIRHGPISIAFMPDEEVGGAVGVFDIPRFGVHFAYTVDGGSLGGINDETFSARTAYLTFTGRDGAPLKGVLVNSLYAVADFTAHLPPAFRPENADGRDGYLHPYAATLSVGSSTLKMRMRDFTRAGLDTQETVLRRLVAETRSRIPNVGISLETKDVYFNMKDSLSRYPKLISHAMNATQRAGLVPTLSPIRGGTDGSNLTNRGVPTPDLFTGGHNFHTRREWNSRKAMEQTVRTLVELVGLFVSDPPVAR